MKRVIGLGGVFFKARHPEALAAWYQRHLGLEFQVYGDTAFCSLPLTQVLAQNPNAYSVVSAFSEDTTYLGAEKPYMLNLMVEDLAALLPVLIDEGVAVDEKRESGEYGHFAWITDPEGNRIELWQAP